MTRRRLFPFLAALALITASCSGAADPDPSADPSSPAGAITSFGEGAFGFAASSNLAVGNERLLVAISNDQGARLASPDIPIQISFWPESDPDAVQETDGKFMWAIEDVSGLYRGSVEFDAAGTWMVEVVPAGSNPLEPFPVTVLAEPLTPGVGDPAPASDTVTLADAPLEEITTDPNPDPAFYQMSVAEAIGSGRPTVIVFATPRFCQTAICGPTMEKVHAIAPAHPDVNFVHVEVFTNLDDPANLETVPAVVEWNLPTEPWIFVVDANGIVTARFEGLFDPEEIDTALS